MAECKDYPPYLDYPKERKKQTNADRIRAMSDEELARYFSDIGCHKQADREICLAHDKNCEWCWLDWLKQEVERDGKAETVPVLRGYEAEG